MHLLHCQGLTRRPWFSGVELELDEGEIVVLTGATGSGKTLLLRALADLDPVDAGRVLLRGVDRRDMPAWRWRSRVLYLHQGAPCLPGSVADNLALVMGLKVHAGTPAPIDRGDLRRLDPGAGRPDGLDPGRAADRLSGGEAQQLALARVRLAAPEVLLLDEPTSALDEGTARVAERSLRAWADQGRGAIWVSHDPGLAERIDARRVGLPELARAEAP